MKGQRNEKVFRKCEADAREWPRSDRWSDYKCQ